MPSCESTALSCCSAPASHTHPEPCRGSCCLTPAPPDLENSESSISNQMEISHITNSYFTSVAASLSPCQTNAHLLYCYLFYFFLANYMFSGKDSFHIIDKEFCLCICSNVSPDSSKTFLSLPFSIQQILPYILSFLKRVEI